MRQIANLIVNHKKTMILLYVVLLVVSLFLTLGVSINFNLADYLPEDTSSKKAIDILEEEYSNNGSANLFIEGLSISEIVHLKKQIKEIDGVKNVVWLDDIVDIKKPLVYLDPDIVDNYLVEDAALMQIIFEENDYDEKTANAIIQIEELIQDEGSLTGPAVTSTNLIDSLMSSTGLALLLALAILLIILIITTTSYFEVILFLVTIGVSVLINNGTNIIFGEISFITSSASAILQIAIAMDYSIFLLHRFREERLLTPVPKKAMSLAIRHSFTSISSSAITTIVGFLALTFMSFTIGFDMGLVLAKGILISLISILTLLPVLVLISDKPIKKTTHRHFLPSFKRLEEVLEKGRYIILVLVIIIAVLAFIGQSKNNFLFGTGSSMASSAENAQIERVTEKFGSQNVSLLIVPNDDKTTEAKMAGDIANLDNVETVSGMYTLVDETIPDHMIPQALKDQFISENYSRYIIYLDTVVESAEAFETHESIQQVAGNYYEEFYIVGETPSTYDIRTVSESDFTIVNTISMVAVGIILLITFKSVLLPLILLLVIQASIWINMAIPYYIGEEMLFLGYLIVTAMQLGATIDYAILLTNRYKENRIKLNAHESAIEAIDQAGHSIFTSATILGAAGFVIGSVFDQPTLSIMGLLVGRGALISGAMVIFVLPQLLVIFDKAIGFTTLEWPGRKQGKH